MSKLIKLNYLIFPNVKWIVFLSALICIFPNKIIAQDYKKQITKIVIDAGHGGKDSGTMGTKRYKKYEKHIALAISLKLGEYIKKRFPDIEIVYTRKKDIFLELKERTELANKSNADLFISIHCDGFTDPKASGASVFVMGMSKLKANMDVAIRENSVIYMEDNYQDNYEGFDPKTPESYIIFSLMQNTFLDQSISFAEFIEDEFANRAKRKSRGVRQAPFYVISRVNMPSVLIEAGFLTNSKEEDFLHTDSGQNYIASAIYRAFIDYKNSIEGVNFETKQETSIINENIKIDLPKEENDNVKDTLVIKNDNDPIVSYKVQVGTYLKTMLADSLFSNLDVEEYEINNTYKYYTYSTPDKNLAEEKKNKLRKKGFPGAFVVAFYKGNQISIKEALDLQNKK